MLEHLKLKYDQLELRKRELEFKIADTKARIKAEEMIEAAKEKEPSAAEKYAENTKTRTMLYAGGDVLYTKLDIRDAHEAGQEYSAEIERERITPSEIGIVIKTEQHPLANQADITIRAGIDTPLRIMNKVKLTPIKD